MRRLASLVLLAVLAAGCTSGGSDGSDDTGSGATDVPRAPEGSASGDTATPAPTGPDCSAVWTAGDDLPDDYTLCVTDGAAGVQEVTECQDGPPLVVFDDELFGRPGGEIQAPTASPVQDTEEYGDAYAECTGE